MTPSEYLAIAALVLPVAAAWGAFHARVSRNERDIAGVQSELHTLRDAVAAVDKNVSVAVGILQKQFEHVKETSSPRNPPVK